MQRRRHPPHHVVADEAGQREDGEQRHERHVAVGQRQRALRGDVGDLLRHALEVGGELLRLGRELGGLAGNFVVHRAAPRSAEGSGRVERGVHDLAVLGHQRALHDLVVEVDLQRLGLLVDHGRDEVQQVAREQRGGVGRELARQVGRTDDLHAVLLDRPGRIPTAGSCRPARPPCRRSPSRASWSSPCPRSPAPAPCGRGSARW